MSRFRDVFLDTSSLTLEQLSRFGEELCIQQRGIMWWIGDTARYAKHVLRLGDNVSQVFPPFVSPGLIQRCEAVASAYPMESERNPLASWTVHAMHANKPDRIALVAASVEAGRTSDEERKHVREESNRPRWLVAFDTHYFAHRHYHSGAGVETAMRVTEWIQRTAERLRGKGATDAVCAFEGHGSFRKELTSGEEWDGQRYKDRPPKPDDLQHQLRLCRELLDRLVFCCVSIDRYEADDVLASYASQFPGKTTIVSSDKDLRSCLSEKCNMLLDVEWTKDEHSGDMLPDYKWLSAKAHTEATGIPPSQWTEYQVLMGDATDGIKGCAGVGEKGAKDLVQMFGTAEGAIQAAKLDDERIPPRKRAALIEFEAKLSVTRQLVTLRTDLELPTTTRL